MKKLLLIFAVLICKTSFAQTTDKEAIKATIDKVFEGMKKGDSSIVRFAFHPKAITQAIGFSEKTNSNYFKHDNRLEAFMKAIGTPHSEVWNEIPGQYEIRIDKQMAQVWMPYEFYFGEKFSHCGINNFTLYKEDLPSKSSLNNNTPKKELNSVTWKIIYLVDTMRKDNCVK